MTLMVRIGIYTRLSQNRDGESTSIDRQLESCRKRMEPGWTEVKVYRDDDISAYSGKVRPAFEEMVADIESGSLDIVLAYALDRLGRRPKDIERLLEAKVRFICVRDSLDSNSASSELFVRILAAMAKMESDNIAARIRLKHEELRATGSFSGGKQPFGWNKAEADLLRKAAKMILDGHSVMSATRETGIPRRSLKRALLSPRMVGKREPDGPVGMPVILEEEDWRGVQAILTDPSRAVDPNRGKHLLSGLLVCGLCGQRLHIHIRKGNRRYACAPKPPGCNRIVIAAKSLEEYILSAALTRTWEKFNSREMKVAIQAKKDHDEEEEKELRAELAALKDRLYPLMDMYTSGDLPLDEWQRARAVLNERIQAIEDELLGRSGNTGTIEVSMPKGEERQWLSSVIEKVVIHPSKGRGPVFNPERVDISFR
jgi:site-specific DNA recombinase